MNKSTRVALHVILAHTILFVLNHIADQKIDLMWSRMGDSLFTGLFGFGPLLAGALYGYV